MPLIRRFCKLDVRRPIQPEVALIVSTYQKPRHLRLSLASIAQQQGVKEKIELVVTDDGSTDETFEVIERFAETVEFPVMLTTHRHSTFQLARCRNEGVAASTAPFLIFADGDLIFPSDFVLQHLARRRTKGALTGDYYRLTEGASAQIDEAAVQYVKVRALVAPGELLRIRKADRRARWHTFIRHRDRPRFIGGNVGIWRSDFERVNGYDENFQGWGCEDEDLSYRLRLAGIRTHSIMRWACPIHVWHPRDVTAPAVWEDGPNVAYYLRKQRPNHCLNGLVKPAPADDAWLPSHRIATLPFRPQECDESGRRRDAA